MMMMMMMTFVVEDVDDDNGNVLMALVNTLRGLAVSSQLSK